MAHRGRFALALLSACLLSSCVTIVDSTWVSGRVDDVTTEDIRAAVAVARQQNLWGGGRPRQIEVIGPDEIHIYWSERKAVYGGHDIVKRIQGRWRYEDRVIITS
jgi:hypothetical protein